MDKEDSNTVHNVDYVRIDPRKIRPGEGRLFNLTPLNIALLFERTRNIAEKITKKKIEHQKRISPEENAQLNNDIFKFVEKELDGGKALSIADACKNINTTISAKYGIKITWRAIEARYRRYDEVKARRRNYV